MRAVFPDGPRSIARISNFRPALQRHPSFTSVHFAHSANTLSLESAHDRVAAMRHLLVPIAFGIAGIAGAAACGPSDSTDDNEASTGGRSSDCSADNTCPPEPCVSGKRCSCEDLDELVGVTECSGDVSSCNCDSCPEFVPEEAAQFTPCGGEPFGRWRTVSTDRSGQAPWGLGTCPFQLLETPASDDLTLVLHEGGAADYAHVRADLNLRTLKSCHSNCGDSDAYGDRWTCVESACGTCECELESDYLTDKSYTWSREDVTLRLHPEGSEQIADEYEYCVEGDTMTLSTEDGRILTLVQAALKGSPTLCRNRTSDECLLGTSDCIQGACVGDDACLEGATEAQCGTISGCEWDSDGCSGSTESSCSLVDYGRTPGCEFVDFLGCTGDRVACSDILEVFECRANQGCADDFECIGDPVDCALLGTSQCNGNEGCTWDPDSLTCSGTTTCEKETSSSSCELLEWVGCVPTECTGNARPCDELTSIECETASGCSLEAP
jgi:hypothetical protein